MSFDRFPEATATTTTDTPVIIEPGRTVNWPVQTILTLDANPASATGWSWTLDPKGAGVDSVRVDPWTLQNGAPAIRASAAKTTGTGYPVAVNPTPSMSIYRTARGLIVGRQYRLAVDMVGSNVSSATRWRIRMGGQVSAFGSVTATHTVTFTAVADEEDLIIELEDNPASTDPAANVSLAFTKITLTGLAYVQTIPPVVNDQVPLTVYDGKITADAGWAPFIQADITVPQQSAAVAAALDPNDGSRVRITAAGTREPIQQYTPWRVTRRNLHSDPGHTGTSRALNGGVLMSCYEQMTGSNVGTTDYPNRFRLWNTGIVAQELVVKTLPGNGASYGLSFTTNPPVTTSTTGRLYLNVTLDARSAGVSVPSTITAGIRVIQGGVTRLTRTQNFTAAGLTQFTVSDVAFAAPAGPAGIRVEVYITNRATTTWTAGAGALGVILTVPSGAWGISGSTNEPADPFYDMTTNFPQYWRFRKADNTIVEEMRDPAGTTLEIVDRRTFDLAVAEREIDPVSGEMRLALASDEYLLQRFSKTADDATPRTREHSLRSVCEYVLGQALGAVPALSGTVDGDVTARWGVDNIVSNPSFETNLDGWSAGTNARFIQRVVSNVSWGAVAGAYACDWFSDVAGTAYLDYNNVSVRAGAPYVLMAHLFAHSGVRQARLMIRFKNAIGQTIREDFSVLKNAPDGMWTQFVIQTFAPEGTSQASFHIDHRATAGGQGMRVDGVMLYEGTEVIPYFDGSQPSTGYTAAWSGAAHASTSTRTPLVPREPQALVWAAGQNAWDFLTPLVNSRKLRLWCDGDRVWHLTDPANYTAPGSLTVTPATTVEMLERVDGERGEYADGVAITWTWTDSKGVKRSRVETAGTAGKIAQLELDSPFPGAGTAAGYLAKLKGRGTERPITVAADYRANPDQPISILTPAGVTSTGEIASVAWNLTDGVMQIEPTALTT